MSNRSSILAVVLCTMAPAATCVAQSYASYNIVKSSDTLGYNQSWTPRNIYAVDVNNDGIPDLIQDMDSGGFTVGLGQFGVSIANGDGTFKPAVAYNYPPGVALSPMTFGDFNGDGKIDIAMGAGGRTIAVYLGRGDGTFVNPWYSAIPMASDQVISPWAPLVAADFNHDGKLDLAVVGGNTPSTSTTTIVYIVPGEGNGLFSRSIGVLNAPTGINSTSSAVQTMFAGDYDSDGHADLAVSVTTGTSTGGIGSTTIHVLYGNGDFTFEDTAPINFSGPLLINSGDLNSDGYADLFALDRNNYRLNTYYGQAGRTFAAYTQQLPPVYLSGSDINPTPSLVMADFNGDNRMDLVTGTDSTNPTYVLMFLATSTPGQFDLQTWNLPNPTPTSTIGSLTSPVVGDFNHDGKPDWAFVDYYNTGVEAIYYTGLNTTRGGLWANCDYPTTSHGVNVCSPDATSGTTVNFNATSHSFGSLRKMELWVDGKKLAEQHHSWEGNAWFNFSSTIAPGKHQGDIFSADIDNTLQLNSFTFSVPSGCIAPTAAGVHICAPVNGATTSNPPVLVTASSMVTGTLARMEVWVDSTKKYTETDSNSLSASIGMTAGKHTITVFAVNTSGTAWSAASTVSVP